jgi:lysophospholipase L1-like esterase
MLASVTVLVAGVEAALRPLVRLRARTTIFERDGDLGWKYRPGADDLWDGVRMRINAKGLRMPETSYAKPRGTFRILFLGDSVTVGWGLEEEQTFPRQVAGALAERSGKPIEAINAGVNGYSPWQEAIYLEKEGLRYEPDLVVLSFVLNDVTERFTLERFGGSGVGRQLAGAITSPIDWIVDRTAVGHVAAALGARLRFGRDPRAGARRQELTEVSDLVFHPDRPDVERAWRITLGELARIADTCAARRIPLAIVVFPFVFQLEDPAHRRAPQDRIEAFAAPRGVAVLDLLPVLGRRLAAEGRPAEDYFLDPDHPSPRGARAIGEILSAFLEGRRLAPLRAAAENDNR